MKAPVILIALALAAPSAMAAEAAPPATARELYDYARKLLDVGQKEQAMEPLTKAAELGLPEAQDQLGTLYSYTHTKAAKATAEKWFALALKSGSPIFQRDFACALYRQQLPEQAPEYARALREMEKAADQGDLPAKVYLSGYYRTGAGLDEKNPKKADILLGDAIKRSLAEKGVRSLPDLSGMVSAGDCAPADAEGAAQVNAIMLGYSSRPAQPSPVPTPPRKAS